MFSVLSGATESFYGEWFLRLRQFVSWFIVGWPLRLFFRGRVMRRSDMWRVFREKGQPLIVAANHECLIDHWSLLHLISLREYRATVVFRFLARGRFRNRLLTFFLNWVVYPYYGCIVFDKGRDVRSAALRALWRGETVIIYPEGSTRKAHEQPIREFKEGVIELHRASGAPILPVAICYGKRHGFRRDCALVFGKLFVPQSNDDKEAAEELRSEVAILWASGSKGKEG